MLLNTIKPNADSRPPRTRVGRGVGSGLGKTAGRGHKGQRARAGGYHKLGFEGGQMPLQRRLPKFGFVSRNALVTAEVRLSELEKVKSGEIDLLSLKEANVINASIENVKIFLSGEIKKPVVVRGLRVTKGAKAAIEKAGGKIV